MVVTRRMRGGRGRERKPGIFISKNRKNLVSRKKNSFPNFNEVRQWNKLPSKELESLALETFKLVEISS